MVGLILFLLIVSMCIVWGMSFYKESNTGIKSLGNYYEFKRERELAEDRNSQIISDMNFESGMKREAKDQFEHWKHWKELQEKYPDDIQSQYWMSLMPRIWLPNPFNYGACFYYIYDDKTAKYKGVDRKKLVKEEVEKLKKEYDNKH